MGPIRENPEDNLRSLHRRVQTGAYRALPSRRTYIPKGGRQATAARHRRDRGQDRPGGGGHDPHANLRRGIPGLQLQVPSEAELAQCAGRARVRDQRPNARWVLAGDLLELNEVGASNLGVLVDAVEVRFIPEAGAFQVRRPVRAMACPRLLDLWEWAVDTDPRIVIEMSIVSITLDSSLLLNDHPINSIFKS